MNTWELFAIAAGLSMDAFAIAVCKGLSVQRLKKTHLFITGAWFGGAQALMPLFGYFLGTGFRARIEQIDHWIAFVLLSVIGLLMIKEAGEPSKPLDSSFSFKAMFPLSVANSIDALTAGIMFAFLKVNIFFAAGTIGIITFLFSAAGVKLGNRFGAKFRSKSVLAGGIILIAIGVKILLEHLNA